MLTPVAVITGATAGIGEAVAHELAKSGYDLLLIGRRKERLKEVQRQIGFEHGVNIEIRELDICSLGSVKKFIQEKESWLKKTKVLINNAGKATGVDPMHHAEISDWEEMIQTNVNGLLYMTRMILPYLLEQTGGSHIVNLGSVAGRWVYPGGGVYCATKHAVRAITEGLRMDLVGKNVRVTNIAPGLVETEFSEVRFKGDQQKAKKVYSGMTPLSGKDIAEAVSWCLNRPPHVNVQEMIIYPTDQASVNLVHRDKKEL